MKTITCIDCEKQFSGETKEELMNNMHPHYGTDHQDVMAQANAEKQAVWFAELDARWEAAEEENVD